jgi:hypothetical protein
MFALDLFNTDYERRLMEGGVDTLEQRRIDDLAAKMDELAARAQEPAYKKNPAALADLKQQFAKLKDERDSYYRVREAGIPGNVPAEKIPGKEDLLKGKGRSYYEDDQKKNLNLSKGVIPTEPLPEHGGGIGPKQRWQDLMPEQTNPNDDWYDDEDQETELRSGDYVRDTMDGESGEVFRMQGDPYERRVRILDRDGKGWYIEPSRLARVDPQDPDVQRYFGKHRQRDLDESANPKLNQLIKMIQDGKITAASLKDPALRPRLTQLVQQADPQADIAQLVATYAPAAQVKATNVNDLKAQARSGNVMAPLPKTSAGPAYAQQFATFEQGVAEGKADYNFDAEDLKRLERIRDLSTLKTQALALISRPSAKPMKPEKVEWFKNALDRMNSPIKVIKLMYDLLLSGEGHAVVGSRSSMNPNSYRQRFGEQDATEAIVASGPSQPLDDRAVRKLVWDTMKINADSGEQAIQRALSVLAKKPQSRMVQDLQDKFQNLADRLAQGVAEGFDNNPVTGAITRRILMQRLDLLKQYGPELVGAAVDNVADYVGDVEEIGSSDVSGWVAQVERMLNENPPEAFAEDLADQVKQVFKDKAGQPVGEIGIDPESSPGNGEWYVHHYATGYSVVGFDSAAEAKRELLYVHKHPDAVKGHPSTMEQGLGEGWSDAIVARRTGQPRTPYSVYIKGRKWKDFENEDLARAVMNKLKAKFRTDGRDPETITIAPADMSEGLKSTLAGAALAGAMALGGAGAAQAQSASGGPSMANATTIIQQIQAGKIQNQNDLASALGNASNKQAIFKILQNKAGLPGHGADSVINALGKKSTAGAQQPVKSAGQSGSIVQRPTDNFEGTIKEEQDTSGVERAILNRIMVAHTDLLMKFGPDKVMQAAEEVAYNVGDVDEIGTSDVSAYVAQVKQILGAVSESKLEEKWTAKYKSSINCAAPKGFSQKAHCAGRKK